MRGTSLRARSMSAKGGTGTLSASVTSCALCASVSSTAEEPVGAISTLYGCGSAALAEPAARTTTEKALAYNQPNGFRDRSFMFLEEIGARAIIAKAAGDPNLGAALMMNAAPYAQFYKQIVGGRIACSRNGAVRSGQPRCR